MKFNLLFAAFFLLGGLSLQAQFMDAEPGDEELDLCMENVSAGDYSEAGMAPCGTAMEKGNTKTMTYLANLLYESGEQSYPDAFGLFKLAAEGGNPDGMFMTGAMYYLGHGVDMDKKEAKTWITKAADGGNESAKYALTQFDFN